MKTIKKLLSFGAALLLSLSSLLVFAPALTHAVVQDCTWTGTAGDHLFSTAGNWSNCNSSVPQDNDNLVFDWGASDKSPDNDMTLSIANISFTGAASQSSYDITGNLLTISGGVTMSGITGGPVYATLDMPLTISGAQTVDVGINSLFITGVVTGSGNLTISADDEGLVDLSKDNSGYTGSIDVAGGTLQTEDANALGAASAGTTAEIGAALVFCLSNNTDISVAEPLSLTGHGNVTLKVQSCGGLSHQGKTATFSGAITLNSNILVGGLNGDTIKITGPLSGTGFTISMSSGQDAVLDVESSNNTSATPNGIQDSQNLTVTINSGDNQPSSQVTVLANQTYVVDGIRGVTDVLSGGILKGTGTVGDLGVQKGGHVAPGHSPGCLNSGNVGLSGTYDAEIGGTTACSGYDQLKVTGTVDVTGGTLNVSRYNDYKPKVGETYTIIDNDSNDAVTGEFANMSEGSTFTVDGNVLKITYKGGDGNDVVLSVQSVPTTPNTGFTLVTSHPYVTLFVTTMLAGAIAFIARRYGRLSTR
jgi:hypothetical protein